MKEILLILLYLYEVASYSFDPIQYHIQTDKGPDRYFRYQTYNGQFRKEKRLNDGSVVGSYGWVDANGLLRLYDYFADHEGYRVVRTRVIKTNPPTSHQVKAPHTPVRRPSTVRRPAFGQKTSASPPNSLNRRKRPQKIRPIVVRRKEQKRPRQPQGSTFGSKVSPGSTNNRRDDGPPEGFRMDQPGGRVTMNYDLGNQYRKEKRFSDGSVIGEHGYVDPMGILRKTYYRSGLRGLEEVKKSYWVGTRSPGS